MVSQAYKKCLLLIEQMVKANCLNQIGKTDLEKLIAQHVGADKRTIQKYVRVCVQFNFLTPHITRQKEVAVYTINLVEADKAMKHVYGQPLHQLTLES